MGHQQVSSRNSNDLGYSDKIKHQINSTKMHSRSEEVILLWALIEENQWKKNVQKRSRGCNVNWTNPFVLGSTINIGEKKEAATD